MKQEKLKSIEEAVKVALGHYNEGNVDIVRNEEDTIDVIYHSEHNSFAIIPCICSAKDLIEKDIETIADKYDVGYCGF